MRLLIDEDLSPSLVAECHGAGFEATSVRDRGMLQASDRQVSDLCFQEDRVLVSNNASDFLRLAERNGIHPGLIFLPLGSRAEMRTSMTAALKEIRRLAPERDTNAASLMVNSVLEVDEGGACRLYEHP